MLTPVLGKKALIKLCALTSGWENAKLTNYCYFLVQLVNLFTLPGTDHDLEAVIFDPKRLFGW